MFGIGMAPTGSKDPFALRRSANGIIKILAESEISLGLSSVLNAAATAESSRSQLNDFFRERLHFYLKDVRNFPYDVVNAVLATNADDVRDAIARAQALTAARESTDFAAISAAFKRIKNILRQAAEKGYPPMRGPAESQSSAARGLSEAVFALAPEVERLRNEREYGQALARIATLRPTVDAFFDNVMVLDPDAGVRATNLGVIDLVLKSFSGIADFSEIVTA
jgi:glycyl-tRNA synthetase beta chain